MELSEINARIAQLKEQIALKEAAQKQIKEAYHNPYSKYHYGYIYDAIRGDRSGLDREAAEAAAYQRLLIEQAQADKIRAEQAYNTAYENDLNRKNALAMAQQNKAEQEQYKLDEYRRGRNKAASIMSSYKEALSKDPNNTQLNKEYNLAKEDFDYYDRKLGGQGYTEQIPEDKSKEATNPYKGLSNDELLSIANSIHSKNAYTNDDRAKLDKLAAATDDQTIKEQILTIKSNKKATKEDKDADKAKKETFAKNWKEGQPFDKSIYKMKFKNGKPYLVVK